MSACCEGDDIPDDRPMRVYLHGNQFAAVDDSEVWGICASGIAPMETLGQKLVALDIDPNRKLSLYRGGVFIGSTTVGAAANGDCNEPRP
jgi:UV DNA damage repair endonuclease